MMMPRGVVLCEPSGEGCGMSDDTDPGVTSSAVRAEAEATVRRAAEELRGQLAAVAAQIDPFPAFPGAVFAYGIEVEPRAGGLPELGCVIPGDDGGLYALTIGMEVTPAQQQAVADASTERSAESRV